MPAAAPFLSNVGLGAYLMLKGSRAQPAVATGEAGLYDVDAALQAPACRRLPKPPPQPAPFAVVTRFAVSVLTAAEQGPRVFQQLTAELAAAHASVAHFFRLSPWARLRP